tara:strand:+ start:347 stop:493 length:147 start_codon:yes stop_codon:yes gene_type:complete
MDYEINISEEELEEMTEMLAPVIIPNREMYPQSFLYYYKVYKFYKDLE